MEGDAIRPVQARRDGLDLALSVRIRLRQHRVDLADGAAADEQGPVRRLGHLASVSQAAGIDLDLEAVRHL